MHRLQLCFSILFIHSALAQVDNLPADVREDTLSRLTLADPETMDDYGREIYDRVVGLDNPGPIYGPAMFSVHMPRVADGMDLINKYLRYDSIIGRALIETAICVLAREFDSQYEWASHAPTALEEDVPQAVIDAMGPRTKIVAVT